MKGLAFHSVLAKDLGNHELIEGSVLPVRGITDERLLAQYV